MVHIKCDNCGEEFPEEEIENHRLRCIYTIKDKELENLIPCEICNQLINFENYHQHLLTCYEPSPPLNSTNFPRLQRETNNNSNSTDLLSNIDRILHNANLLTQHIRGVNSYLSNELNDYENFLELDRSNHLLGVRDVTKVIEPTEEDGTCLICTENICGLYKTKCGHLFCKDCIQEWFKENRKCPVCMKEF